MRTILAVLLALSGGIAAYAADKPAPAPAVEKDKPAAKAPSSPDAKTPSAPGAKAPSAPDAKPAAKAQSPEKAKPAETAKAGGKAQPQQNKCVSCHSNADQWDKDDRRYQISRAKDKDRKPAKLTDEQWMAQLAEDMLAKDIHWQKGIRCVDCHGGDPTNDDSKTVAHSEAGGFRPLKDPAAVPELCGKCHSDINYMKRYQASPRTDQLAEYWTSGHGRALKAKGDKAVATCTSCHGKPHGTVLEPDGHGIRRVSDLESPVYRTQLAKTCAKCHSDAKRMAGREYHGKPLRHDQLEQWEKSVHAELLLKKGDLSAPTCNNCHGNHGALPPQVDSIANVCGTCHGRVVKFFADTKMKHSFEKAGLPGCATCHGNHLIVRPTDEMLGMGDGAFCIQCHKNGEHGATVAGADTAKKMRQGLDELRALIGSADETLDTAGRLGMEVSKPRFELRKATDALKNARVQIHSFAVAPTEKLLAEGRDVAAAVRDRGEGLLAEHHARRVWLAASLVPIVVVVVLLLLYIRSMPITQKPSA